MITSVERAPSFTRIRFLTESSPKITWLNSKTGLVHLTRAFLELHINGMLIGPVSASNGKTSSISSVNYGKNRIVIEQDMPGDSLPGGVYMISKKSFKLIK